MRNSILLPAAALILGGAFPATIMAQDAQSPGAAPVEQIQANPRGPGPASAVPPNPATAEAPVPPAMPADPNYHAGPYTGALTPPPLAAMDKSYPVCSKTVKDECVNPSQAAGHRMASHLAAAQHHRRHKGA